MRSAGIVKAGKGEEYQYPGNHRRRWSKASPDTVKVYGGLQGLLNASIEEIAKVPGISQGLAEKIYYSLKH
jgi:DNA integrity scanning protein DisA with diadenylate cyclase activity